MLLSQCVHLHRLVHGSSYTLHVHFPLTVFFFCRSSEQAQGSPLELVEVTSSPPHSHLPAMIDWRRNVLVTLQAPPVHCSQVACPLNMYVQRVLVWRQVSFRTSARLEQCSLTITPGKWMETYKGITLLLSKMAVQF